MSEVDYVIPSITVKQSAIIHINDLYKIMKRWFSDNGYYVEEKEYNDTNKTSLKIKWACYKKIDDYLRFVIVVKLKAKNIENITIKNKKMQKAEMEIVFESYLESDYKDYWEEKGTSKFLRGIYDKYVQKNKREKYNDELKEETHDAYNEVKSYLGLHVLK